MLPGKFSIVFYSAAEPEPQHFSITAASERCGASFNSDGFDFNLVFLTLRSQKTFTGMNEIPGTVVFKPF
jgi:hypothetical protein